MAVINDVDIRKSPLVKLAGEVNSSSSGTVHDVLTELLASGCMSPRVDLTGISSIDSDGVLALLRGCERFRANEGDFVVISVNPIVRERFESAGHSHILTRSKEHAAPHRHVREPIVECFAATGEWEMCSFSIAARLDLCKVVRNRVAQMTAGMPFSAAEQWEIKMAVGEAVSNAIRHGCGEQPRETVTVRCIASRDRLVVEIIDGGPGFDPNALPPSLPGNTLPEGSMGLRCISECMDEVDFSFGPGTTVRLVKYVKP